MSDTDRSAPLIWIPLMALAFLATALFGVVVVRWIPHSSERPAGAAATSAEPAHAAPRAAGVRARIVQGPLVVERDLPAAAFALPAGASLDPRVAPGGETIVLEATFVAGGRAWIGAQLQGGSLIVTRGEEVLLSDAAEATPRAASTAQPVLLAARETLRFEFRRAGSGAAALRATWRPETALVDRPLPAVGAPLRGDARRRGTALLTDARCVACHEADGAAAEALRLAPGPDLARIGARARPAWLRRWILAPHALREDARMPAMLGEDRFRGGAVDDLVHYLVSLGGPADVATAPLDADLVRTGMLLYHQVGCVACHGPLEPAARIATASPNAGPGRRPATPLGAVAAKWPVSELAAYLADPLAVHPEGLMPAMDLAPIEAQALASYLVARDPAPEEEPFTLDAARAARGRAVFRDAGCTACHEHDDGQGRMAGAPEAPRLAALAGRGDAGCLAETPPVALPQYDLDARERGDLAAALELWTGAVAPAPTERLAADLVRFDCLACHAFHGDRGAEPTIAGFFTAREEADLGDEGRIPPDLTDAGARLTTSWMTAVLEGEERARPWLAARMPRFGAANVDHLAAGFAASAGATALLDAEPTFDAAAAREGRALVGTGGLNCIQCHDVAGRASIGTPGPDLALMPGRLHWDFFRRWMHEPNVIVPGTRMPQLFVGGVSQVGAILGGRAEPQVAAIWAYLSQGENLALPEGLGDPQGLELTVGVEPIVFRTFIAGSGVRAIACGFPEQIHAAFDADRCDLAAVWRGRFLSAAGAWANRGGSETNPDEIAWSVEPGSSIWLAEGGRTATRRAFRGYRLDADRRPVFLYDLVGEQGVVQVEDAPYPAAADAKGVIRMRRRLAFVGTPGTTVVLRVPEGFVLVEGTLAEWTDGHSALRLDTAGSATLTLELER